MHAARSAALSFPLSLSPSADASVAHHHCANDRVMARSTAEAVAVGWAAAAAAGVGEAARGEARRKPGQRCLD